MKKIDTSIDLYTFSELHTIGVKTFVTGRHGGISNPPFDSLNSAVSVGDSEDAVTANLALIKEATGSAKIYLPNQVHGTAVVIIDSAKKIPAVTEADAVIVSVPGVVAAVRTADCLPILIADPVNRIVAAIHAGRQGTELRIASKTVEVMTKRYGACSKNLAVVFGPAIGGCCYEVDQTCADNFHHLCGGTETGAEGRNIDIIAANREQLQQIGVAPESILESGVCTACHSEDFYSYRASGGITGRFVSGISLGEQKT